VSRGFSLSLAGAWLGMLLTTWAVATASFRTVDRTLGPEARREVAARLAPLPAEDRRALLRHVAAEINRWMFRSSLVAQALLAGALTTVLWPAGGGARLLAVSLLAIVLLQGLGLTPAITALGRSIDFLPRPLPRDVGRNFGILHSAYLGADLAKAALLVRLGWLLGHGS
jgi:hypothetical protein